MITVGVLAAGATAYSANQASKASKKGVEAGLSAAEMERQTATDTLNYYKERDSQSFALQAAANAIAGQVANSQVALMDQQRQISGELHTRTKDVFWPLEDQIIKEAKEYDTPERQEREAGKAMADVESQLSLQRQASNRGLMRLGVNPNSAKFGLEQNMMSLGEGSAKAAAGNAARSNIEATGWARRFDAAGLGRNLPTTQVAAANSATAAGNGAMNAAYAPVNAANTQTQLMGGALSQYGVGMSNANRLITQSYGNQADMWGGAASGLASLSGSLMGRYTANNQGSGSSGLTNFGNTSSGSSSILGAPATQSYNDLYLA
jgi:hypothetical protein